MPAAEDLLARTPGWDASAGGRDGGRMGVVEGVAGEGTEAGWKGEVRFAPARCLRAAARPVGGGTLRRLGTGSADRQVSQVETGAAGERCTAGGWDSFQSWRRESRAKSSTGCTGQTLDRHTGQTDSSWGAEQAAKQQRQPEALEGWHRERRCAMPKRTGAMLETQTTPEPSAARASLMDGVRTTCRPTRPMLRARKKSENVSRALPGLAPGPLSRCQWQWGGAEPVAAVCRPVPVHSLRSASASQRKMTVRCPRKL